MGLGKQILSNFNRYNIFSRYKYLSALYRLSVIQGNSNEAIDYLRLLKKLTSLSQIKKDIPLIFHHDITSLERLKSVINDSSIYWSLLYDYFPILSIK